MQSIFPVALADAKFHEIEAIPYKLEADAEPIAVMHVHPEFVSCCPHTGYPDFATVNISYVPAKHKAELKALKIYLSDYMGVGIHHEESTMKIAKDFVEAIKPARFQLCMNWGARGGVYTAVQISWTPDGGFSEVVEDDHGLAERATKWSNRV